MMIYEFRCYKHGVFEVKQDMLAEHIAYCPVCKAPAQRVYHMPSWYYDNPKPLYHKDGSFEEAPNFGMHGG